MTNSELFEIYDVKQEAFDIVFLPCLEVRGSRVRYLASTFQFCRHIFKLLSKQSPDLVYGRYLPGCAIGAACSIPTVFEAHMPIGAGIVQRYLYQFLSRRPTFVRLVAISNALKRIYVDHGLLSEDMIVVAHDAAEVSGQEITTFKSAGCGRLQVGYVGSLFKGRGVGLILELARVNPEIDFHFVGGPQAVADEMRDESNQSNVFFHGPIAPSKVWDFHQRCDVLLAPYQRNVAVLGGGDTSSYMSPMKIFEYMASGRPIIASDLPVLREVLSDDSAVLVECDDVAAWSDALNRLKIPAVRQRLAESAFKLLRDEFTWAKRVKTVLHGLCKE